MARDELIRLAKEIAARHDLDGELVCAVIEQESAWNCWAMRYEPGFFARYVAPLYTNNKVSATEAWGRAFSWGLMQVMGQVARENGFDGKFLAELCDPRIGIETGCRVLVRKLAAAEGNVVKCLLLYNGGQNTEYPSEVLARVPRYR